MIDALDEVLTLMHVTMPHSKAAYSESVASLLKLLESKQLHSGMKFLNGVILDSKADSQAVITFSLHHLLTAPASSTAPAGDCGRASLYSVINRRRSIDR